MSNLFLKEQKTALEIDIFSLFANKLLVIFNEFYLTLLGYLMTNSIRELHAKHSLNI